MKFRKSIIAFLSIFMLSGCRNTAVVENKPKDELEGSITIWASKDNVSLLNLSAYNFNKLHSSSVVKIVETGSNELFDKLQLSVISKENLPDLICIGDEEVQRLLKANSNDFKDTGDDIKKENYLKYKTDNLTFDGKIYGYPVSSRPVVMLYRSDIYKSAGLKTEYIKTWQDYMEAGRSVVEKSGKPFVLLPFEDEKLYRTFLNQLGGSYFDREGKIEVNSQRAFRVLEMMKRLQTSGASKGVRDFEEAVQLFKKEEATSILASTDQIRKLYKDAPELKEKLQVMRLPAFEEGGNQASSISGSNLILMKETKNKKLAQEFAKFTSENRDNLNSYINELGEVPAYTYYNDEKGFGDKSLLELSEEVYSISYTDKFNKVKEAVAKAVIEIFIEGKEPSNVMNELQKNLSVPIS
jgi:ABC-type glycerol-3-phosphate transport system substrate-binding protein